MPDERRWPSASLGDLLRAAQLTPEKCVFSRLAGGANNCVYRLGYGDQQAFLLKQYFADARERLRHDFGFSTFLWNEGIRCIPQPYFADYRNQVALFEFVPGTALHAGAVSERDIGAAASFMWSLRAISRRAGASELADAADRCFTAADHLQLVLDRVSRLRSLVPADSADRQLLEFLDSSVVPELERALGRGAEAPILPDSRSLSPSDIGFHNALRRPDGSLCFFDFEYAGWDSLLKMLSDFLLQPRVPMTVRSLDTVMPVLLPDTEERRVVGEAIPWCLRLHRIKWVTIILNEFVKSEAERRVFAAETPIADRRHRQLQLAREYLASTRQFVHP